MTTPGMTVTRRTIFDAIREERTDEFYEPEAFDRLEPTMTPPGSRSRVEVLKQRVAAGYPLWHKDDADDLTGADPKDIPTRRSWGPA